MAAIEPRLIASKFARVAGVALALVALSRPIRADRTADVRADLGSIATALSAANPADAMTPFDKSFPDYDKLANYFQGLNAFQVQNEVDIVDEQDTGTETKLTVDWTLTLTDLGTNSTERRTGEINVRLVSKKGKWKIVDFSPISLFNPQQKPRPER